MKTKLIIAMCAFLFMGNVLLSAQGLYSNKKESNSASESSSTESSGFLNNDTPILKGPPGGGVEEPGESPVGDSLWFLLLASAAYGIKVYSDKRASTKE